LRGPNGSGLRFEEIEVAGPIAYVVSINLHRGGLAHLAKWYILALGSLNFSFVRFVG
jgi:hypothetical protein